MPKGAIGPPLRLITRQLCLPRVVLQFLPEIIGLGVAENRYAHRALRDRIDLLNLRLQPVKRAFDHLRIEPAQVDQRVGLGIGNVADDRDPVFLSVGGVQRHRSAGMGVLVIVECDAIVRAEGQRPGPVEHVAHLNRDLLALEHFEVEWKLRDLAIAGIWPADPAGILDRHGTNL